MMRWLKALWPLLVCFGLMHNPLTHFPVTFMVISLFIISYKLLQPGNLTELGFKKFGGRELVIALVAFSAIELIMDFAVQPMVSRLTDEPADYTSFEFYMVILANTLIGLHLCGLVLLLVKNCYLGHLCLTG
jgi:uncharacterized protein